MNAEEMQCKVPKSSTTSLIPPPPSLQGTHLQDTFLLLRKLAMYWGIRNKEAKMKSKTLVKRKTSHLLTFQSQGEKKKMPQLHPCERKPDSSINTQKEGRSNSFYFLLCTFVLKESYSWLVLDSPSHSWVTTEAESQTSSHLAVQMAKTKSLGTFCPKPNGQETEFPQPSLPAHFCNIAVASWKQTENQQLLLSEGTFRGCI